MEREPKKGVPVCSKPKCVKKKQRYVAAGEWETWIEDVNCGPTDKPVTVSSVPKSKSHVVLLKERTKERIRKAQGPSSTPKTELPQGPDVPPAGNPLDGWKVKIVHNPVSCQDDTPYRGPVTFMDEYSSEMDEKTFKSAEAIVKAGLWGNSQSFPIEDATAGLPPEALPELKGCEHREIYIPPANPDTFKHFKDQVFPVTDPKNWPPIQHHGTENSLARSIISKVPATKLDPNSEEAELARLEKSQLRTSKKKD